MNERGRQTLGRLLKAAITPQVLVASLLLLAALGLLASGGRRAAPTAPVIDLGQRPPRTETEEVRLQLVDEKGLERGVTTQVPLPKDASLRLSAVLGALREELVTSGTWPAALPGPRVFIVEVEGRKVAVIDLRVPTGLGVSVGQELAIYRSLAATAEVNGAASVRFLRDGQPAATLLGHVAVPSGL